MGAKGAPELMWEGRMRRTILCLLPLAAAFAATPAHAQGGAWRISEVTGDVKIAEGGRMRAASRGALLSGGSVIAGARARAVLVRGRQYVVVAPNSTLRVDGSGGGASAGDMVQMILEAGSAVFRVNKRETPHFRVQTRYLAAVVRGTTFSVTVTPTGGSVQVTEGAVEVSTPDGGARDLVRPGMIATVSSADLYQLSISGDASRTIRSPAAPAAQGGATVSSRPVAAGPVGRIGAPIGEAPVRLSDATNGLVRGSAAIDLAFARGSDRARATRGEGGRPDGAGRPDHSRGDSPGKGGGNDGNRGHGNDEDRNDEDNPGRGGVPGGKDDRDEDRGNGGGNGGKDDGDEGGKEDRGDDPGRGGADEEDDEEGKDKDRGDGGEDGADDRPADDEDDSDDDKGKNGGDDGDDGDDVEDGKDKDGGDDGDDDDGGKDKDRGDDDDDGGKDKGKDRGEEDDDGADDNDDDDDDDDDGDDD
jgi:hypothetical protein